MNPIHILQRVATYTNSRHGAKRFRRVAVVGVLVVGLVLSGAVVGPGLADDLPADEGAAAPPMVEFTCNEVRVAQSDPGASYHLVVHYVVTTTGERGKALISATGTFSDQFGGTDIVITEVDVMFDHGGGASGTIPARCR